jgi:antitoxin VapB
MGLDTNLTNFDGSDQGCDILRTYTKEVAMAKGSVFLNNRTQAVRLPKAVALPDGVKEVSIRVVGASRVITPVGQDWDSWFEHGPAAEADFLQDRDQGVASDRQPL